MRGSITERLTPCLTGTELTKLICLNNQQIFLFGLTQASKTGGELSTLIPLLMKYVSILGLKFPQSNFGLK